MRLNYRVLWIENDSEWVESIREELEEIISDFGLESDITNKPSGEENLSYNGYDLILMDLALANDESGDALISRIRSLEIFTDIVFYSASGIAAVKEKASSLNLEGVYFADRNQLSFTKKIREVISASVRRVQDLVNLRGVVMAEVSELDSLMEIIVLKYFSSEETLKEFHKHVSSDREKSIKKLLTADVECGKKCHISWKDHSIDEFIKQTDSSQKAHAIKIIVDKLSSNSKPLEKYSKANFYEEYNSAIISVRNNLAHCVETENEEGAVVLKTRNGNVVYGDAEIVEVRKQIQYYHSLFIIILEAIQ